MDGHVARQAGIALRVRKDVLEARFDPVSRNMLLTVLGSSDLDKAKIDDLLTPLDLFVRCLQRQVVDDTPVQLLDPGTCQDATLNK